MTSTPAQPPSTTGMRRTSCSWLAPGNRTIVGGDLHRAWVRSAWEAVREYSTGGNYVNAQTADETETRMREA